MYKRQEQSTATTYEPNSEETTNDDYGEENYETALESFEAFTSTYIPSDTFFKCVYYFRSGSILHLKVIYGLFEARILLLKLIYGLFGVRILLRKYIRAQNWTRKAQGNIWHLKMYH